MGFKKIISAFLVSGILIVLSACGILNGSNKETPRDQFYDIPYVAPAKVLAQPHIKGILGVARPEADAVHDDRAILFVESDRPFSLNRHSYHFWRDPPPNLIRDRLYNYLAKSNLATKVVRFDPGVTVNYIMYSRLIRFERIVNKNSSSDEVLFGIELSVSHADDGRVLIPNTYYEDRLPIERLSTTADTIHASVIGFGKAFAKTMDKFVQANTPKTAKSVIPAAVPAKATQKKPPAAKPKAQ